jgi:hypothetical protein
VGGSIHDRNEKAIGQSPVKFEELAPLIPARYIVHGMARLQRRTQQQQQQPTTPTPQCQCTNNVAHTQCEQPFRSISYPSHTSQHHTNNLSITTQPIRPWPMGKAPIFKLLALLGWGLGLTKSHAQPQQHEVSYCTPDHDPIPPNIPTTSIAPHAWATPNTIEQSTTNPHIAFIPTSLLQRKPIGSLSK